MIGCMEQVCEMKLGQRCLPKVVPEPVHTLRKGHLHEVRGPQLTEPQKWTRDIFYLLRDHIVCHLKGKSEFRTSKGSASQASAAASSASRRETVHMEPFEDTFHPEFTYDGSRTIRMSINKHRCDPANVHTWINIRLPLDRLKSA